jgi:hypothetical protein
MGAHPSRWSSGGHVWLARLGKISGEETEAPAILRWQSAPKTSPLAAVSAVVSVNFAHELNQSYRLTRALASREAVAITADRRE